MLSLRRPLSAVAGGHDGSDEPGGIEFRILGPLEVLHAGKRLSLGGPRDRALLAVLLVHAGEVVSADRLVDALWGRELPGDPRHALQAAVSRLRRAVWGGPGASAPLVWQPPGYVLDVRPEQVDAVRFDRLVDEARRHQDAAARVALLEEALALWRGPALSDVDDEPWAQPHVGRLEERRLGAFEDVIDARFALGRHVEVLGRLGSVAEEHPSRERLRGQLMLALYRAGRQTEALEVYETSRRALAEELGVDPGPGLQRLHHDILRQDPALEWTPPAPPRTNLPQQLTSFVGREQETQQLSGLLWENRLVTLAGPGGSGKTRLAVEVAATLEERYRDGVWMAELAPVTDPSLVPQAVASALGVAENPLQPLLDTVVDAVRDKQLLIVLDNCEHLIDASADLAESILSGAQRVAILATSRQPLGIPGETVLAIPPLPAPDLESADPTPESLAAYDAVRLFVDRATAADPGFRLDDATVRAVAEICSRLEGLPLALELAAARVRGLGVAATASRLGDRFALLSGARRTGLPKERSFRAAVDWSYDLLSEQERRVFERLSMFAGGFSLSGAEAVACGDGVDAHDVPDLLARLVDRSLVVRTPSSPSRYRLLEPLRQYATERLTTRREADTVGERHLRFFLALAEEAAPALRGPEQRTWLDRLEVEHDNLGSALTSAVDTGLEEEGLRLAAALGPYWQRRGHFSEGRDRLRTVLSAGRHPPTARAGALVEAGYLAFFQCDYRDTLQYSVEALDLYRRADDRWGIAYALGKLGLAASRLGDLDRASAAFDESIKIFQELGDSWGVATTLGYLGFTAASRGVPAQAEAAYDKSLTWFRAHGDASGVGVALGGLGGLALQRGDLERAEELLRASLETTEGIGDRWGTASAQAGLARVALLRGEDEISADLYRRALCVYGDLEDREDSAACLEGLAELASHSGDPRRAAELFAAADALRPVGTALSLAVVDPAGYQRCLAMLRSQLGDDEFRTASARGRSMTLRQARDLALSDAGGG